MEECHDLGLEESVLQLRQISLIIHLQGVSASLKAALQSQASHGCFI
jgi:hypothetical protein